MLVLIGVFAIELGLMVAIAKISPDSVRKKWARAVLTSLSIAVLIIPFGFRAFSVGTDTLNYKSVFDKISASQTIPKSLRYIEIFYSVFNYAIGHIWHNYTFFLVILGTVLFSLLFFTVNKLSIKPYISMVAFIGLGMYAQSMNAMRQYLALAFVLLAIFELLKRNRWFWFLLFIVVAFFFHKSAAICVILLPIKYLKLNYKTLIAFAVAAIVGVFLFPYAIKLFDLIFKSTYYNSYGGVTTNFFTLNNILFTVAMIACLVAILVLRNRVKSKTPQRLNDYDFFAMMFIIFVILKMISLFTIELADRLGLYFIISLIFILPLVLETFNKKEKIILTCVSIAGLALFMTYLLAIYGAYGVLPYKFI